MNLRELRFWNKHLGWNMEKEYTVNNYNWENFSKIYWGIWQPLGIYSLFITFNLDVLVQRIDIHFFDLTYRGKLFVLFYGKQSVLKTPPDILLFWSRLQIRRKRLSSVNHSTNLKKIVKIIKILYLVLKKF